MLSKTLFHFLIPEAEGTPSSRLHENLCCITYLISQANSWTFETGHGLELTNPRWRFFALMTRNKALPDHVIMIYRT